MWVILRNRNETNRYINKVYNRFIYWAYRHIGIQIQIMCRMCLNMQAKIVTAPRCFSCVTLPKGWLVFF